jgi:4'-phosphopantetheinyl transferase
MRYALTRSALRRIVARRIGASPQNLVFSYGEHGKPTLMSPPTFVQFSVSHAAGLAIIGVSDGGLIGVDVESIQTAASLLATSNVAFSDQELKVMEAWIDADKAQRVSAAWTVKEAILKADGRGLSIEPREIPVLLKLPEFSGEIVGRCEVLTKEWSVRVLAPRPGFIAAVASSLATFELAVHEWKMPAPD